MQVYLPLSYLYGKRATGELTPLVMSLRQELYTREYSKIDWNAARNQCAKEDLYYPHPWYQVGLTQVCLAYSDSGLLIPSVPEVECLLCMDFDNSDLLILLILKSRICHGLAEFFSEVGAFSIDKVKRLNCYPLPFTFLQDLLWWSLYKAEPLLEGSSLRSRALEEAIKNIHYEVHTIVCY